MQKSLGHNPENSASIKMAGNIDRAIIYTLTYTLIEQSTMSPNAVTYVKC